MVRHAQCDEYATDATTYLEPEMEEEEPKQSRPITRQMDSEIEKKPGYNPGAGEWQWGR